MSMGALSMFAARSFGAMANYVNLDKYSRNALDLMSKEIRQSNGLKYADPNYLWFESADGGDLLYFYVPSNRTLYRYTKAAGAGFWKVDSKPLLEQCDYLKFALFQRNPMTNSYNQYPTASADTCKLVQLSWVCSRQLVANRNTESVQSAKVVIRKK
jgi:hypothetical protein